MSSLPKDPPEKLLGNMAIRYDHGLGFPGYYDQEIFMQGNNRSHQERYDSTIRTMRQLYEEVRLWFEENENNNSH